MLNFFRRIRRKLIDEGNLKRYLIYAVGEILLVMIGILLALQVNNWNEIRKSNKEELELLKSLYNEFTFNKEELHRCIDKALRIQWNCEELLANTGTREIRISRQVSDSLINSGLLAIITYDASNGILDNIINSGKIHIIRNERLKNSLSNWDGILNDVKEDEGWAVTERNNIIYPFIYRNSSYVRITQSHGYYKGNIISGFSKNYRDIYKLLEFENLVNSRRIWNIKNEENYHRLKKVVEEIISLCEQEIELKR